MRKAPLPHNKRYCYPPYPDHYLMTQQIRIRQQSNTKKDGTLPTNSVVFYIFARLLFLLLFFIAVNSSTLGGREDKKVSQQF